MSLFTMTINCPKCRGSLSLEEQRKKPGNWKGLSDVVCLMCGFRICLVELAGLQQRVLVEYGRRERMKQIYREGEPQREEERKKQAKAIRQWRERRFGKRDCRCFKIKSTDKERPDTMASSGGEDETFIV